MDEDLVYQERANYGGQGGTLILTRSLIKFTIFSASGQATMLFRLDLRKTGAMKKGLFRPQLVLHDEVSAIDYPVSVTAPEIWVKKLNTIKGEIS